MSVLSQLLMSVFSLSFDSREKLWICMEYCGGGSLQDIYHGTLGTCSNLCTLGMIYAKRKIKKQITGGWLVLAGIACVLS